jgi:hypothetical protein
MRGRRGFGLLGLGLGVAGVSLFTFRRQIIAQLLRLPPVRCMVGVERKVPVPMPDGVVLMVDQTIYHDRTHLSALVLPIMV